MTAADAAAVDDLLTAAEAVDRTDEHFNLEDVLEEVENPMIDVSRDWLVAEVERSRRGSVAAAAARPGGWPGECQPWTGTVGPRPRRGDRLRVGCR